MRYFSLLFFLWCYVNAEAAEIYGRVTDENNEPLAFAGVYIKGTSSGVATNIDGDYTMHLEPGNYIIVYQYLGYRSLEKEIHITERKLEVNMQLEPDSRLLQSVEIRSDAEDPAYAIIRIAMENREKHLKENDVYSCDVYIKGLQRMQEAPDQILGVHIDDVLDIDSNNTGVFYLSESASRFYFQYPDRSKEIMYASKMSGNNNQFSYNDARSMQLNLYESTVTLPGLTPRGLVSPIAGNAFLYYTYSLQGTMQENGHDIYKISVMPKNNSAPAFSGDLYISDQDYRISSNSLYVTKENGVDFIDTFRIKQQYIPLPEDRWILLSSQFSFSYSLFGFKGNGYANAFYKNYQFDSLPAKGFFNGEISRIESDANKKDSTFWNAERPVQLTKEESSDYVRKDSIFAFKNTDAYKDSMDHIANKLKPLDLLTGYSYRNTKNRINVITSPLFDIVQFNTVDGYVLEPAVRIRKALSDERSVSFTPAFRYGSANHMKAPHATLTFDYNELHSAWFMLQGGIDEQQFNQQGISAGMNSLYTLLLEENYLKLYKLRYASFTHSTETWNGLYVTSNLLYAERTSLSNTPGLHTWVEDPEKEFTANELPAEGIEQVNDILQFSFKLKYSIAQQYITLPGKKYILDNRYPDIYLSYKKAIGIPGEKPVKFDYLEIKVNDEIGLQLAGNINYSLAAGKFFSAENLSVADIKHFSANQTIISKAGDESFLALPYYVYSTDKPFFEVHTAYHTEGFLFQRLPVFKQLKLQPVFTANALFTNEEAGNYVEAAAGIEHIFKILRFDIVGSKMQDIENIQYDFRIGIGF